MRRFLAAAALFVLSALPAWAQNDSFTSFITNAPNASTPLGSSDWVPVIQGGVTKHVPGSSLAGGGGTPGGVNGSLQYNNSGSFGGYVIGAAFSVSGGTFNLLATGVTATTYGDSTHVMSCAVNAAGQATSCSNVAIAGGGSNAFSALTSSTNTTAAMVVGTGASLAATGSGTITATAVPVGGVSGLGAGVGTWLATPSGANLASALTTPLTIGGGGTGATSLTGHGMVVVNTGGTALSTLAPGANNNCAVSNGTDWTSIACPGGGSISVSGGGNTTTGVSTLALGNGLSCAPNGANTTSTCNLTVTDVTKSADYQVAAGDMANALTLTGAHTLTLPAVSSTIFQPGMAVTVANVGSSAWTLTNSTGLTIQGLTGTSLPPGTNGTFVANGDGTHLDFFGVQQATTSIFGIVKPDGSTITISNGVISAVSGGAGTVTQNGNLTSHAPLIGGTNGTTDAKSVAAMTNGQLLVGSTGADPAPQTISGSCTLSSAGVLSCGRSAAIGWIAGTNPNNATILTLPANSTVTSIVGRLETPQGAAATATVNKAASGTACSAGTALHSGSFNANGTAATNQTLTVTISALAAGDSVCLQTTGTWTATVGTLTVSYTTP